MARSSTPPWMEHLPLVLLGIRTSVRQDSLWCPTELIYGATLRLPGEFLYPPEDTSVVPSTDYVARLRLALAEMRPATSAHNLGPSRAQCLPGVPLSLADFCHVYVRVDVVRRLLSGPYEGPFLVLQPMPKTFVISHAGESWTVSVDRLKPAWGLCPSLRPAA